MIKTIIISLLLTVITLSGSAQKVKTVEAEFTYYAPESVSLAEARRYAQNQARLKAIAEEFGTIVAQTNLTHIDTNDDKSSTRFSSYGSTDVKGEWIEDTGKPEFSESYEGGTLVVTCKVKGKAREIVSSKIDLHAKVLCNGTEDRFEGDRFKSGDELYLSFQSPVDGYLAVYLVDDDEQVQCLLPYTSQTNGIYQVVANRKYILFSEKAAPHDQVDEYVLTANHDLEHNQLYVIFSPNEFVKAVDEASSRVADGKGTGGFPREVSFDDFHKWLAKCRRHDKDMCLNKILITIKK